MRKDKRKYKPYNFDVDFQYRTYKNIGKNYKIQFCARKSRFYKIYGMIREWCNKNEKKYKNFDTCSQWKSYIEKEFKGTNYINHVDFKHYLKQRKEFHKSWLNISETIVTPIYMCLITMQITVYSAEKVNPLVTIWVTTVLSLFIFFFLTTRCRYHREKYNFFKDFIRIL